MAKSTAAGAATVSSRKKIGSKKPAVTAADIIAEKRGKKIRPLFYIASFLIPFLLTLIAYIGFGVYPFGERSVLTLDLNGQYIYYFEALRRDFWGDGSAFYSWSRNLSGGFMGIIGYYLASPFTLIIMVVLVTSVANALFGKMKDVSRKNVHAEWRIYTVTYMPTTTSDTQPSEVRYSLEKTFLMGLYSRKLSRVKIMNKFSSEEPALWTDRVSRMPAAMRIRRETRMTGNSREK